MCRFKSLGFRGIFINKGVTKCKFWVLDADRAVFIDMHDSFP